MGDGGEIANCGTVVHCHDDFVNEVGSLGANDGGSEDFAGCAMREKFYESLGFAHDERFAVIVEWVAGGKKLDSRSAEFGLGGAYRCELGLRENGEEFQVIIHHAGRTTFAAELDGGVVGGDLSLLDGDMDDLEASADITCGEDVSVRSGLVGLNGDASVRCC